MKKSVLIALIASTALATSLCAQPAPGGPTPPPPPPMGERGAMPPPPTNQLQTINKFEGKVVKMATNDEYVYDGFYMLYGTDSLLVKFPPHLGSQITSAAKTGASVVVSGVLNTPPMGGKEIRLVSLTAGGQTIIDAPPATQPTPPVETLVKGAGKITSLQTDREGRVKGFMLDKKTILQIPPPVAMQLGNIAQAGTNISYTGMQKTPGKGEVSSDSFTIVHCSTISINGQEYLVK